MNTVKFTYYIISSRLISLQEVADHPIPVNRHYTVESALKRLEELQYMDIYAVYQLDLMEDGSLNARELGSDNVFNSHKDFDSSKPRK